MKRISTLPIKRILCLTAIAVVGVAPQAAKAETFYAPDGGFVLLNPSCRSYGINIGAISTSGHYALIKLWARYEYPNGSQTAWELRRDWTIVHGTNQVFEPVVNTNTRYAQVYAEVAIWNGRSYNMFGMHLALPGAANPANSPYWCWT